MWNIIGYCYDIFTTDFFITTTLQPTQNSELVSLWPNNRSLFFLAPYSPELAPCDFSCSQNLNKPLIGRRFQTISEIKANVTKGLKAITKKRTRTVPRSGNTVGISVCVEEESTLKRTQTCNFQIKYIFMTSFRVFFEQTSYVDCNQTVLESPICSNEKDIPKT